MALPTDKQHAIGSSASGTLSATFSIGTIAGNLVVVCIATAPDVLGAAAVVPSSVTDDKSNTYTLIDTQTVSGGHFVNVALEYTGSFYYCPNCIAGAKVITANGVSASPHATIVTAEYPLTGATPLDKHVITSANTGTAAASGNTASLSQSSELVIGWVAANASTISGQTPATNVVGSVSGGTFAEISTLNSSGTSPQSSAYTLGASASWVCGVVTFKIQINAGSGTCALQFGGKGAAPRHGAGTCAVKFGGSSGTLLVTRRATSTMNVVIGGSSGTLLVTRRATSTMNVQFGGTGTPTAIRQRSGTSRLVFSDAGRGVSPGRGHCDIRFGARGNNNLIHSVQGHLNLKFQNTGTVRLVTHIVKATCKLKFGKNVSKGQLVHQVRGTLKLKFSKGPVSKGQAIRQRKGTANVKLGGKGKGIGSHKAKGTCTLKFVPKPGKALVTRRAKATIFAVKFGGSAVVKATHRAAGSCDLQFGGDGLLTVKHFATGRLDLQFGGVGADSGSGVIHHSPGAVCSLAFAGGPTDVDIRFNERGRANLAFQGTGTHVLVTHRAPFVSTALKFGGTGKGQAIRQRGGILLVKFGGSGSKVIHVSQSAFPAPLKFGGTGSGFHTRSVSGTCNLFFDNDGVGLGTRQWFLPQVGNVVFGGDGAGIVTLNAVNVFPAELVFDGTGDGIILHIANGQCDLVFDLAFPDDTAQVTRFATGECDVVFQAFCIFPTLIHVRDGVCNLVFAPTGFATTGSHGQCDVRFGGTGSQADTGYGTANLAFAGTGSNFIFSRAGYGTCNLKFVNFASTLNQGFGTCNVRFGGGQTQTKITRFGRGDCNLIFRDTATELITRSGSGTCHLVFSGSGATSITHVVSATCNVAIGGIGVGHGGAAGEADLAFGGTGDAVAIKIGSGTCDVAFGGSLSTVFVLSPGQANLQFQGNGFASATRVASGTCDLSFVNFGTVHKAASGQCDLIFDITVTYTRSGQGECDVVFANTGLGGCHRIGEGLANIIFGGSSGFSSPTRVFVQVSNYANTPNQYGLWVLYDGQATLIYVAATLDIIMHNIMPPGAVAVDQDNGVFKIVAFDADSWYSNWLVTGRASGRRLSILSTPIKDQV